MKSNAKFLISLFLTLPLTGCVSSASKSDASTLRVWYWMSDREPALEELSARYEAETGIKVHFELIAPSEVYAQRVKASAQSSTLPDIFGVLGEKRDFASFIRAGRIARLTAAVDADGGAWRNQFFPKTLEVNSFEAGNEFGVEPGLYGIPIDATSIQMVYNKRLLREAGLDGAHPPKTWEEFLRTCAALKAKGTACLVCGFGEVWMIDALSTNWAMNLMGEKKVFDTYRGLVPYTDPDWVRILSLFKTMADEKILLEGSVTMANKMAEQPFANDRAAFTLNGSWSVNVFRGMNPNLDYGVMLPPRLSEDHPMKIWGGAGTSFVVNDKSPRRDAAIRFLRWLTDKPQQSYLTEVTVNLPSNRTIVSEIPPILSEYADDLDEATHPNVYPVHELAAVSEAFQKGIQSILIGEQTPEEVARKVQRVKEKEQNKLPLAA